MKKMLSIVLILSSIIYAQDYVGSTSCQTCHTEKYSDWFDSGHPYKFNITDNAAPVYPDFVTNFQDAWDDSIGFTWDQVSGVIGGFGWKARFVDQTGKLIGTANSAVNTGLGHNQFNFYDGTLWGIANYHPADDKTYSYGCFRCHTTGPEKEGTWLAGVADLGTFAEGGVGCEACHGPGSDHVSSPTTTNIDLVYEYNISDTTGLDFGGTIGVVVPDPNGDDVNYLCGTCHNRGFNAPIEAKGGYIKHHEVWEESLTWDGHSSLTCTSCHDPHKRVIWDGDGITVDCSTCHANQVATINHSGTSNCVDCHMPYAGKSAVKRGDSGYKGDIHSHLFKITVDDQSMFTDDGHYVKDDSERPASLDLGFACLGCHNDDPADAIPEMELEQVVNIAAGMHAAPVVDPTYVGSVTCGACHTEKYSDWFDSGHPYKFNITDNAAPVYPDFVTNYQDAWDDSIGFTWDQVSGVIGGFGWKARFVDQTGKLIGTANSAVNTGLGHNQFNFYDGTLWGIANYHPADDKTYSYGCFRCHTTGPEKEGTWLAGVADLGTFAEGGIGCEACHGPGSNHVSSPTTANSIDRVYEYNISDTTGLDFGGTIGVVPPDPNGDDVNYLCGTCHNRGFNAPIEAKGGYIKHHEVWEESLTWDGHSSLSCTSCHDPHKRVIWDGDGITVDCSTCHATQVATLNHSGTSNCVDCHMPYAGKSAVKRGDSGYKGDIHSHLFKITVDDQSMFTDDGKHVKNDSERPASLDLGFSCLGCHNDDPSDAIPEKTIAEAVAAAANMHGTASTSVGNSLPDKFQLAQNYPNPFNPMTIIPFDIQTAGNVKLVVYNLLGQEMAVLVDEHMTPGEYKLNLNAQSFATGVYIYDITVDNSEMGIVFKDSKKMVIMK